MQQKSADSSADNKVELNIVHTPCKHCVFAQYDGNTQTGCAFQNRVGKFREGGHVLEAYDEEREFFIVNGRSCTAFRDGGWAKHFKREQWVETARRELALKVDFLIPVTAYNDGVATALSNTLADLKNLKLPPASVHLISNQNDAPAGRLHVLLRKAGEGLNWFLTDVVERTSGGGRVSVERAIDLTVGKLRGHFYSVWLPGYDVPPTFTEDLDRAVTDELKRFSLLTPTAEGNALTVAIGFHRAPTVCGNRPMPSSALTDADPTVGEVTTLLTNVVAKAKFIASTHNMPHLIESVTDVCQGL